jgi:major vault protein
MAFEI